MALFNEIQVGRFNAILHKLLDIKEGAPSPQLSGDISPTIVLEHERPEWKFLGGERNCRGGLWRAAGGAGTYNKQGLFNPVGSGVIAVCRTVWAVGQATNRLGIQKMANGVAMTGTTTAPTIMDSRSRWTFAAEVKPTCQVRYEETANSTTPGTLFTEWNLSSTTIGLEPLPLNIVLTPGYGFGLINLAANNWLACQFDWYERNIEASEER